MQDAEAYQKMLDTVERLEANEGIRQGLQAASVGKSKPARKIILAIKEWHTVSRIQRRPVP